VKVPPVKSVLRVGGAVARWWSDLTMTARVGVALLAVGLQPLDLLRLLLERRIELRVIERDGHIAGDGEK